LALAAFLFAAVMIAIFLFEANGRFWWKQAFFTRTQ
jgi:hypothetical protein